VVEEAIVVAGTSGLSVVGGIGVVEVVTAVVADGELPHDATSKTMAARRR
jgi:hypothetical protein